LLLPLSLKIVGTNISLGDNARLIGAERGGGGATKNARCSELEDLVYGGFGGCYLVCLSQGSDAVEL